MTDDDFPNALPAGHRLHWYVLERVLGQGGFGITYLAHDTNLDRRIAIKEYLPTEIARRRSDASARPHTESQAERYAWGLERFLLEARTLARFDHPNIVRVLSVFEANNTAYMVMRFEEGEDLAAQLERRGTLPERQLTDCLLPILDGLQLVHAAGFIHRDIKPENIYMREDGSPVLLDFGSARQSFGSNKTMTILVAPGYAPLEQYYGDAATQGPWTDIYGLGATCYRAIAGRAPLDAVARAKGVLGSAREMLVPAVEAGRGRYGEAFLMAIDRSLSLSEGDRPQSIGEWKRELLGAAGSIAPTAARVDVATPIVVAPLAPAPSAAPVAASASPADTVPLPPPRPRRLGPAVAGIAALIGVAIGATVLWPTRSPVPSPIVPAQTAPTLSATPATPATAQAQPAARLDDAAPAAATALAPASTAANMVATSPRRPGDRGGAAVKTAATAPPLRSIPSPAATPALERAATRSLPAIAAPAVVAPSTVTAIAPAASLPAAAVATTTPREATPSRPTRDDPIDVAELALRRGDAAAAVQLLTPFAAAGVPRAQALLGRAQEARTGGQQSDFEAFVWYGIAARAGQSGAQAARDKVATRLQPAEIRQAEQIVERWKPRGEAVAASAP